MISIIPDKEYLSNRDIKKLPKQGLFWCGKCDRNIIGIGEKCRFCGFRHKSKKYKK